MNEHELTAMARTQLGLATRDQARAAGLSPSAINRRVASGRWLRIRQGIFVIGAAPPSWEQDVLAACLAGGSDVFSSHLTAARHWSVVRASGRTEVVVAGTRRVRLSRVRVHQSSLLPALDCTVRGGIPVTTLPRTLIDASSHQSPRTVGVWIDEAIRAHGLDLLDLRSCLARLSGAGRRHLQPIRAALDERTLGHDPGDSELEARARRALVAAGLPAPVQQHPVRRSDGRVARIDMAYPPERVAIELDGWDFHGRRSAFDPDRIRRNELTLLGWDVYQFTASMPDELLTNTIRQALSRARAA